MKRAWSVPLLCLALTTLSVPAAAQPSAATVSAEDQAKAQRHFQRAKELYEAGNYRDAVPELETARKLDPKAKNLVMNLGIVNEKLGKYDEALAYFKTYIEMESVTAAERNKAEAIIKRIEGAKRELPKPTPTPAPPPTPGPEKAKPASPPPPPERPLPADEHPRRGRVDALTIGFGSLAAVGLLAGTGFGIYALTSKPRNFVTGRDGSYDELQEKTSDAHSMALIADVSLGVGAVAAVVAAGLYFGRTKESAPTPRAGAPRITATPLSSGGALFVGGVF